MAIAPLLSSKLLAVLPQQWQLLSFLAFLPVLLLSFLVLTRSRHGSSKGVRLPPGPAQLPVLGNLHQLDTLPHRSLRDLARQHGPVMLLRLGTVPAVVVSSAEAAREVMKVHDADCCSRPASPGPRLLSYDLKDVAFAPYDEYWREMRKLFIVELLSMRRVKAACSCPEHIAAKSQGRLRPPNTSLGHATACWPCLAVPLLRPPGLLLCPAVARWPIWPLRLRPANSRPCQMRRLAAPPLCPSSRAGPPGRVTAPPTGRRASVLVARVAWPRCRSARVAFSPAPPSHAGPIGYAAAPPVDLLASQRPHGRHPARVAAPLVAQPTSCRGALAMVKHKGKWSENYSCWHFGRREGLDSGVLE
ncbi:hypothetical protein PR202_gb26087 [Eleusine coracana subsp. coracana]|uniref:Uncharacterized protein n=1 Tax=Eleusine coracana subsp. coracana TaxID=191504 RepID=A0AAV5FQY6_ELECO|nr:hypothetical protein PR202_gb26087 [Eleusine coracana subsp. coracana]